MLKLTDARLETLYCFYHRQWWCYKQQWSKFKWIYTCLNAMALLLVVTGMIVGPVMKNSILVATLAAVGTFVKGLNDFEQYRHKLRMNAFAYTSYAKALIELRNYARGVPTGNLDGFVVKMATMDDIVVDLAPPIPKPCLGKYQHTYQPCEVDCYKKPNPLPDLTSWSENGRSNVVEPCVEERLV